MDCCPDDPALPAVVAQLRLPVRNQRVAVRRTRRLRAARSRGQPVRDQCGAIVGDRDCAVEDTGGAAESFKRAAGILSGRLRRRAGQGMTARTVCFTSSRSQGRPVRPCQGSQRNSSGTYFARRKQRPRHLGRGTRRSNGSDELCAVVAGRAVIGVRLPGERRGSGKGVGVSRVGSARWFPIDRLGVWSVRAQEVTSVAEHDPERP